jgi:hypothetical protein
VNQPILVLHAISQIATTYNNELSLNELNLIRGAAAGLLDNYYTAISMLQELNINAEAANALQGLKFHMLYIYIILYGLILARNIAKARIHHEMMTTAEAVLRIFRDYFQTPQNNIPENRIICKFGEGEILLALYRTNLHPDLEV